MSKDASPDRKARHIGAVGPAPGATALRAAYLDLLKLAICDLVGATTREVRQTGDKRWFSRELTGEDQLAWRAAGKDWPLDALTMIGLARLDDLQHCVETVVQDGVPGDLIEAGCWRGGAGMLIRATLDSLGARDRTVWLADSFTGFPPPDDEAGDADQELEREFRQTDYFSSGLDAVRGYFSRLGLDRGVRLVPGYVEDTMPRLEGNTWSLIRLDLDTYSATRLALEALYPRLAQGGHLIIDDYFHPYLPQSCRKAVDDFRSEHGITDPIRQIDWNSGRWQRSSQPHLRDTPATDFECPDATQATHHQPLPRLPTDREVQLEDEIARMAPVLAAHDSDHASYLAHPLTAALRSRLRRGHRRLKH